jgi:copper-binding protein NosD
LSSLSRMISVLAAVGAVFALTGAPAPAATLACGDKITQDTIVENDIVCTDPAAIGLVIGADNITVRFRGHSITGAGALGQGSAGIATDVEHTGVMVRDAHIDGFDSGIAMSATNSDVRGNVFSNVDTGMSVFGDGNFVYRNVMASAGTLGLDIFGNDVYLWGNWVTGKPAAGIAVDGDNSLVVRNKVLGCSGFDGITISGYSTFSKVAQNTVTGCDSGIAMVGAGNHAHLQSSNVSGNCDGLFVTDPTAFVWRNNAHDNRCSGISLGEAGATVQENAADNNGGIGIDAVLGTIDGGGNHASGNPDGDCFVVICTPSI